MTSETTSETNLALEGKLLVATPFIDEAPYRQAVVLMMQHSSRGACGLVLENNLQASLEKLEAANRAHGPHKRFEDTGVEDNRLDEEKPGPLQLFAGCILWPPGQLEREVEAGIWMTTNARLNSSLLTDDLWVSLLSKIGRAVLEDALHIKAFPPDAALN